MRWLVAAGLAAGVLAGCGIGDSTKPTTTGRATTPTATSTPTTTTATTATTPTTTTTATTTVAEPTPSGGCSLTDAGFHAGGALDCMRKGADVHLVHKRDILTLRSVLARLLAVNTTAEIAGKTKTFQPKGFYVRVTLAVTNLTHRPQTVHPGQTALIVGGRQFDEAVALEDGQDGRSLLSRAGPDHPLVAGASVTGEVVFDVPSRLAGQIPRGAWVAIAGFGASLGPDHRRAVGGIALGV